jgi:hypothetical protein
MYFVQILWFLTWPALIAISYFAIRYTLKKFEEPQKPQQ